MEAWRDTQILCASQSERRNVVLGELSGFCHELLKR